VNHDRLRSQCLRSSYQCYLKWRFIYEYAFKILFIIILCNKM